MHLPEFKQIQAALAKGLSSTATFLGVQLAVAKLTADSFAKLLLANPNVDQTVGKNLTIEGWAKALAHPNAGAAGAAGAVAVFGAGGKLSAAELDISITGLPASSKYLGDSANVAGLSAFDTPTPPTDGSWVLVQNAGDGLPRVYIYRTATPAGTTQTGAGWYPQAAVETMTFEAQGLLTATENNIGPLFVAPYALRIESVTLVVAVNGSSSFTELDLRAGAAGAAGTTVFSTRPRVPGNAGVTGVSGVTGSSVAAVVSAATHVAGTVFTADLTSVAPGAASASLIVRYRRQ